MTFLRSDQVRTIERLVGFKARVKYIENVVGSVQGAKVARAMYSKLGERPPNGMPGAASAIRIRLTDLKRYTAMAANYVRLRSYGVKADEAAMHSFSGLEIESLMYHGSVNQWLGLCRDIEAMNAGLFACEVCSGQHLWQGGIAREYKRCIWCGAPIKMSPSALLAIQCCSNTLQRSREKTIFTEEGTE